MNLEFLFLSLFFFFFFFLTFRKKNGLVGRWEAKHFIGMASADFQAECAKLRMNTASTDYVGNKRNFEHKSNIIIETN